MTTRRRVTSTDVARETGVSRATVGFVLNETPGQTISESTRAQVREAADRLGYTPYAPARALRKGRSDVVLMLLPGVPLGPIITRLIEELTEALAAEGLTLLAHVAPREPRLDPGIWQTVAPAAVVMLGPASDAEMTDIRRRGIDLLVPFSNDPSEHNATFQERMVAVGRIQVEHLAALGHRHLGYALPDDARLMMFAQGRLQGVRDASADLGLPAPQVRSVGLDPDGAREAVAVWRSSPEPVTAVCAFNDEVAISVLAGAHREGVAVPGDLAVVGVDDIPLAAVTTPPLTTVAISPERGAADLHAAIVRVLAGEPVPPAPGADVIRLVVRGSA